ncbi:MAG: nickel pincer cofactor biosynthesis protein LarB [Thermoleophilia bacterium]
MNITEVLEGLSRGELTVAEAESRLALSAIAAVEDFARLDLGRHGRKGVPEVIYSRGKSPEQLRKIVAEMLSRSGRTIISGLSPEEWLALTEGADREMTAGSQESGVLVLRRPGHETPRTGGIIGILSAGTADVPVAEQARFMAEEMGCEVIRAYDVGVAGVHRLSGPLQEMVSAGATALVVAAGMEGALPSVIAGLVSIPVIGLPTATGYGLGGEGVTALLSMLQSCCPGLVAVNIGNGIGAGATAALIANRAAVQ